MVVCDDRPGHPPDGTVCADRRPWGPLWPAPSWPAQEAVRCRIGVPGGGAGAAGRAQRASLAADVLRAAGAPVPVPAAPARLSQALEGGGPADLHGHGVSGHGVPVVGRRAAADRCHPGAVRRLAANGAPVRAGRVGELRLLRCAFALVLGPEAVCDHHRRRDAGGLVPGRSQARRAGGGRRTAGPRPRQPVPCARA